MSNLNVVDVTIIPVISVEDGLMSVKTDDLLLIQVYSIVDDRILPKMRVYTLDEGRSTTDYFKTAFMASNSEAAAKDNWALLPARVIYSDDQHVKLMLIDEDNRLTTPVMFERHRNEFRVIEETKH